MADPLKHASRSYVFPRRIWSFIRGVGIREGSPWSCVTALELKKTRVMVLPGREKFYDVFSCLEKNTHECDRQTDIGRRLVPRLRVASRDKNLFDRRCHQVPGILQE